MSDAAAQQARSLHEALKARDRMRAVERAQELEWMAERLDEFSGSLGNLFGETTPGDEKMSQRVKAARAESTAIRKALEEMEDRLSGASPEMQQAAKDLADKQQALRERTSQAADRADQAAAELPMKAPGLSEGVRGAESEMERAESSLRQGSVASAEGSERLAADKLAEAQRALERAKQDAMDMAAYAQGQGGQGQASGESNNPDQAGSQGSRAPVPMELPRASEFKTPEDYRRALLQGMEGDVPKEYEALKRRYYEELVRQ